MPRQVDDQRIKSRAARERLKPRGKPYFRALDTSGLHLGYRKGRRGHGGAWVVRRYVGGGKYLVETIGAADDLTDATPDGATVLSFEQAQAKAREIHAERARLESGDERHVGPYTVQDALADYHKTMRGKGKKSVADSETRAAALILPALGGIELRKLTTARLRAWLADVAAAPPRLRSKMGKAPRFAKIDKKDPEALRRRQATANRTLTILKAALNHAFRENKVTSDAAWRRVEPFEGADAARVRFLTVNEAKRLINASDPAFRPLVEAGLATGCRYGELVALRVADFNDAGTVFVQQSKSGRARHVVLAEEGMKLFGRLTAGKARGDLIFARENGIAWKKSEQHRHMRAACARAKIAPPVGFHILRHTYASLSVMNGVPLLVVARNLGHADGRMAEKHYSHLAQDYVADAIRKGAPVFGLETDTNIVPIKAGTSTR